MSILPVKTPLGIVPLPEGGTIQSGVVDFECQCLDPFAPGVARRISMIGTVNVVDGQFVTPVVTLPWNSLSAPTPTGTWFLLATWSSGDNLLKIRGSGIVFGAGVNATPAGQWNIETPGVTINPTGTTTYRLDVYWEGNYFTGDADVTCIMYLDGTEVLRQTIQHMGKIGYGFGWNSAHHAPPCYPVGGAGTPINPAVPMTITITDLGGDVYQSTIDDPNQSGFLSDPAGPPNNIGGATTQCAPGLAPCADIDIQSVQAQSFACPDLSTRTLILWPAAITGFSGGPSGSGSTVTTTIDLSDANLATFGHNGGSFLSRQSRDVLATWITDFGNGVPITITAATANAVECYTTVYPGGPNESQIPDAWGFTVFPIGFATSQMSSLTEFNLTCTPYPVHSETLTVPTIQLTP